jgi:peptidoglycan hydrolase-like protein with peptidoglycan-binding domain
LGAKVIAVALALGVAFGVFAAQPTAGKTPAKSAKKKTATKKTAAKTKGKTTAASKQKPKQAAPRRSTQTQPSVDRYKEIQQALTEKGYFNGPVNGTWGADSVDALKRFQRDQNIGDDGKLGSLSLIALGLGPRRDLSNSCATPPCGRTPVTEPPN